MSTVHANSADDALRRIETMVLMGSTELPLVAVREQVFAAVDLVVHTARGASGRRLVDAAHEVHRAEEHGLRTLPLVERGVVVAPPTRPTRRPGGRGFAGAAEPS